MLLTKSLTLSGFSPWKRFSGGSSTLLFAAHIAAELERRPDGEAYGIAPVPEQVVEQMIVHRIGLETDSDVPRKIHVRTASETVETGPVLLLSGGSQLPDDARGDRVGGVWRGRLMNGADGRSDEQRGIFPAVPGKLRTGGVVLRLGVD